VDDTGDVVERFAYDPYGTVTIYNADWSATKSSSDHDWIHLHQGGRYDEATGLYHFRHRDNSPTKGRWIQLDPLGFGAGDINLYRYCVNSPTNVTDPTGLFVEFGVNVPTHWSGIVVTGGVRIDTARRWPIRPFVGFGIGTPHMRVLSVPAPSRGGLHVQVCGIPRRGTAGPFGPPVGWPAWLPFPRFIGPGFGIERTLFPGPIGPIQPTVGGGSPGWFGGFIWVF
jgi:RHS repeat-associated protein